MLSSPLIIFYIFFCYFSHCFHTRQIHTIGAGIQPRCFENIELKWILTIQYKFENNLFIFFPPGNPPLSNSVCFIIQKHAELPACYFFYIFFFAILKFYTQDKYKLIKKKQKYIRYNFFSFHLYFFPFFL